MPEVVQLDEIDLRERELYEQDLYSYTTEAWKYVEAGRKFVSNWHIEYMCEIGMAVYSGQLKDVIMNVPPRHMKSLTVNVFLPTWWWAKKPSTKFLLVAHGRNLVLRDSGKSRRLIKSPWYQKYWGNKFKILDDQDTKSYYANDQGGARVVNSLDAGVTGEGGDVLIIDDPLNIQLAQNSDYVAKVNEVWDSTLYSRVDDPTTSPRILIMQRLHENDLTGHLLAEETGWTHFYLPTRYEHQRKCVIFLSGDVNEAGKPYPWAQPFLYDPRTRENELLFPQRFPKKHVDNLQKKGDHIFTGQQQQRPSKKGGTIFKEKYWRFYDELPMGLEDMADACQSWDCAFKDLRTSSYVCGTAWARFATSIYLMPYRYWERADILVTMEAIRALTNMYPWIGAKLIEDKANGPAILTLLKNEIPGLIPFTLKGEGAGTGKARDMSKEARAIATAYLPQAGNVFLPNPKKYPWVKGYIAELADFPNGTYNDQVDSTTQALMWFHMNPIKVIPNEELMREGQDMGPVQTRVF